MSARERERKKREVLAKSDAQRAALARQSARLKADTAWIGQGCALLATGLPAAWSVLRSGLAWKDMIGRALLDAVFGPRPEAPEPHGKPPERPPAFPGLLPTEPPLSRDAGEPPHLPCL